MSINKNALLRYKVLDKCFSNFGRMYFWEDLLENCNNALLDQNPDSNGISRRQLFDDIRFMESEQGWSIDLVRHRYGRKVYYRYLDPSFSISNQPLKDSEIEHIKYALEILSRFSGTPQFSWVNETITMLENRFELSDQKKNIISFESNIDLVGYDFILPIYNAIINERVINIKYQDFRSSTPYLICIHPYYLKQYNNRWFLLGLWDDFNKISTLALDRIKNIEETNKKYIQTEMDWENDYFYDIIGVTRSKDRHPELIQLEFSSELAPYIITKPLHPTQIVYKSTSNDGAIIVKITVIQNYELERLLLSFGENVKVISPKELKKKLADRLKSANKLYNL